MKLSTGQHVRAWWHHAILNLGFMFSLLAHGSLWEGIKAFFFIFSPPQWHHKKKQVAELSQKNTLHWFLFGLKE